MKGEETRKKRSAWRPTCLPPFIPLLPRFCRPDRTPFVTRRTLASTRKRRRPGPLFRPCQRRRQGASREQGVCFRGHDEVVSVKPTDLVGLEHDGAVPPSHGDVGMMPLPLRKIAHLPPELHRLGEVPEPERSPDLRCALFKVPPGGFPEQRLRLLPGHGGNGPPPRPLPGEGGTGPPARFALSRCQPHRFLLVPLPVRRFFPLSS